MKRFRTINKKIMLFSMIIPIAYFIFQLGLRYYLNQIPKRLPWIYKVYYGQYGQYIIRENFIKHIVYFAVGVFSVSLLNIIGVLGPYKHMKIYAKKILLFSLALIVVVMEFLVLGILPRTNIFVNNYIFVQGKNLMLIIGLTVTFLCVNCNSSLINGGKL